MPSIFSFSFACLTIFKLIAWRYPYARWLLCFYYWERAKANLLIVLIMSYLQIFPKLILLNCKPFSICFALTVKVALPFLLLNYFRKDQSIFLSLTTDFCFTHLWTTRLWGDIDRTNCSWCCYRLPYNWMRDTVGKQD